MSNASDNVLGYNPANSTNMAGLDATGAKKTLRVRDAFFLIAGFLVVQFLTGVFIGMIRGFIIGLNASLHASPQKIDGMDPATMAAIAHMPPWLVVSITLVSYVTAALWAVWYTRRRTDAANWQALLSSLNYVPPARQYYVYAIIIAFICSAVVYGFPFLVPLPKNGTGIPLVNAIAKSGPVVGLLMALFSVTIAPLAEEFIYRGAAFKALQSAMRPAFAAAIVTVLFILMHTPEKIHYPPGFVDVGLLALGAVWLRIKSNSVWPPTLLHALYNFGVIIAAILLKMHVSH